MCLERQHVLLISFKSSGLASYVAFGKRNYKTKAEKSLVTVKMNYVISNDVSCALSGFNFASKLKIQ